MPQTSHKLLCSKALIGMFKKRRALVKGVFGDFENCSPQAPLLLPPHAPTPELTDKNHCETELIPLAMSSHGRRGEGIPLGLCPHEHITSQRPPHF